MNAAKVLSTLHTVRLTSSTKKLILKVERTIKKQWDIAKYLLQSFSIGNFWKVVAYSDVEFAAKNFCETNQ